MKYLFTIIIVFSFFLNLQSQQFNSGILIGFTGSQVDGDRYYGYNKLNAQGGIFVNRNFSDVLSAHMELKYIGKGSVQREKLSGILLYKVSMHYLEVPLLIRYKIKNKYYIYSGLSTAIMVGSYEAENDAGFLTEIENGSQFKKLDFNFQLGMSYQITEKLFADVRFAYSLFPVKKDVYSNPHYQGGGFNNNLLEFGLGYYFKSPTD